MNYGSLAATLMQKATRLAGDGAGPITIHYLQGEPVYDPVTGTTSATKTDVTIQHTLVGDFSNDEIARYRVDTKTEKIIIARNDLATIPTDDETVTTARGTGRIIHVKEDMLHSSVVLGVEYLST